MITLISENLEYILPSLVAFATLVVQKRIADRAEKARKAKEHRDAEKLQLEKNDGIMDSTTKLISRLHDDFMYQLRMKGGEIDTLQKSLSEKIAGEREMAKCVDQMQLQMEELQRTNRDLTARVTNISIMGDNAPVSMWSKGVDGRMVWLNKHYREEFGVTDEEYIGKYDSDVWGEDVARLFRIHDNYVMERMERWVGVEIAHHRSRPDVIKYLLVVKYPMRFDGIIMGVAGMALNLEFVPPEIVENLDLPDEILKKICNGIYQK